MYLDIYILEILISIIYMYIFHFLLLAAESVLIQQMPRHSETQSEVVFEKLFCH